jgi:tyrosine-specific transport protein
MNFRLPKAVSGSLLIAGTTIGAGMLGIPLLTANAGFYPAVLITVAVWLFMYLTGLLFLEATLWLPPGANVLSMSNRLLGHWGRAAAGATYLFLYYCLMVAYFAAGAPIFSDFLKGLFGLDRGGMVFYGLLFGGIVVFGMKLIDRINLILVVGLIGAYVALVGTGYREVEGERLLAHDWGAMWLAAPVLFSAFGYHNIIPSLTHYFEGNLRVLRRSILWGTLLPLVVYLIWQALVIGAVPVSILRQTSEAGQPATEALEALTGSPLIILFGRFFGFFAIVTSMLGVAFSMVDFLGDGIGVSRKGVSRVGLTLLTFLPPFLFAFWDPGIFLSALGVAGGFGEAFLNGLLPVLLVWVGRYRLGLSAAPQVKGAKCSLILLGIVSIGVMLLELSHLLSI